MLHGRKGKGKGKPVPPFTSLYPPTHHWQTPEEEQFVLPSMLLAGRIACFAGLHHCVDRAAVVAATCKAWRSALNPFVRLQASLQYSSASSHSAGRLEDSKEIILSVSVHGDDILCTGHEHELLWLEGELHKHVTMSTCAQFRLDHLPSNSIALVTQFCVPGTQAALSATCSQTVYKVPLPVVVPQADQAHSYEYWRLGVRRSYEWSCSECRYPRCAGGYCTDCGIPREEQDN